MIHQDFYTVEEIAEKLGIAISSVRKYLNENRLKGYKQAGRWYVLNEHLLEFVKDGKANFEN